MAGIPDGLSAADGCAIAYTMLVEELDRANEIRYQAHISALFMGGEGEAPNLSEMKQESRDLLDETLSAENELTPEQRVLREALGLRVR